MKCIIAAFAVLLLAFPAYAGWNLQQHDNDDGASWINGDSETVGVGDTGLVVYLTDVSKAGTTFVVTHRPGTITKAYIVFLDTFVTTSPEPLWDISVSINDTGTFQQVSGVSDEPGQSAFAATAATSANLGAVSSFAPTVTNTVSQGSVIAIHTGGQSSAVVRAMITIVIE